VHESGAARARRAWRVSVYATLLFR